MGSLKSLTLLALLFSLSLAVIADTSNDAAHAKDEVKPSEETDAIEPQQGGRGGCRYGCCGSYAYGQCSACCSRPQAVEAKAEANKQPQAVEAKAEGNDVVVEPQQWWPGGCRWGCCGWFYGRCNFCCLGPQAVESLEPEAVEANAVEPQQRWGGRGCRYGCCGVLRRNGRCSYCCRRPQDEINEAVEAVEPQQSEKEKKKEESKP
ncbi:Late embryogenesis abundant protein M10 [Cardamine amara subsp. amara]|uniref:Late embryogenesis abundant protein M10 n=1 Tax=Cardamine amara subsp. amara TaxID=228776 RepID=A0ABD0ZKF1_CARAN